MCWSFGYCCSGDYEEELRVVGNNMKSLEVSEEKANQREESYKEQIEDGHVVSMIRSN